MKNALSLSALVLLVAGTLSAAPLETKGIPAEAVGVVHFDLNAAPDSVLVAEFRRQIETSGLTAAQKKSYEDFKKETGFNPATDLNDVTVGVLPDIAGTQANAVVIARGRFSAEKLAAAAKRRKLPVNTQDGYTTFRCSGISDLIVPDFGGGFAGAAGAFVCVIDKNTLLLAPSNEQLAGALRAFSGKAKSYAPPAALKNLGTKVGSPVVLAGGTGALFADMENSGILGQQMPKPDAVSLAIGATGKNMKVRIAGDYASEPDAAKAKASLQLFAGLMQFGAAQMAGENASPTAVARIQRVLGSINLTAAGKRTIAALDCSAVDVLEILAQLNKAQSPN